MKRNRASDTTTPSKPQKKPSKPTTTTTRRTQKPTTTTTHNNNNNNNNNNGPDRRAPHPHDEPKVEPSPKKEEGEGEDLMGGVLWDGESFGWWCGSVEEDVLLGWFPFVDEHFLFWEREEEDYDIWQLQHINEIPK